MGSGGEESKNQVEGLLGITNYKFHSFVIDFQHFMLVFEFSTLLS